MGVSDETAITHKFCVYGHEFYFKVHGFRCHGDVYELDCVPTKESAIVSGLLRSVMATASAGLQHGVPLEAIAAEWKGKRFEPSGHTENPGIPYAKSILDYLGQYLEHYQAVFPPEKREPLPQRKEVPQDSHMLTHKFSLAGHEGYLTFAIEPLLEFIRLRIAKEGSFVNGLAEGLSDTATLCIQYGVPPGALLKRWKGIKFPPSGVDSAIGKYTSVVDYAAKFLVKDERWRV